MERAQFFYDITYYSAIVLGMIVFQLYYTGNTLRIEKLLTNQIQYEKSLNEFSETLLSGGQSKLEEGVKKLLEASKASRIYVFENFTDKLGALHTRQTIEVCSTGVTPQINNASLQDISYSEHGFKRWANRFQKNEIVMGAVDTFPAEEKLMLQSQGIKSLLAIPFVIEGKWAGLIGFDQVDRTRNWTDLDINLLKTAANILGIAMENNKQKKAIEATLIKLETANQSKDRLFSIIAHDLINPFNSLLGCSEILVESLQNKDIDDSIKTAHVIQETSESTFRLLENLLLWSRTQTGKLKLNKELFNLKAVIMNTTTLYHANLLSKQLDLICDIPEDIQLYGDKAMMDAVFRNLINNAIKFTKPGGYIRIEYSKTQQYNLVSIKDSGIGMSKQKVEELMKEQSTTSTKGTAGESGTGLGLMLCKEFVEKHKGKIQIESEPENGTTFTVALPVETDRLMKEIDEVGVVE